VLRDRLGTDDIISVLQQNRVQCMRKEVNDWVKKCMEKEAESFKPRGETKRPWREIVQKDCQARKLNREDDMEWIIEDGES